MGFKGRQRIHGDGLYGAVWVPPYIDRRADVLKPIDQDPQAGFLLLLDLRLNLAANGHQSAGGNGHNGHRNHDDDC